MVRKVNDKTKLTMLFAALQDEMLSRVKFSNILDHPTDQGDNAEVSWIEWFNNYLPKRYKANKATVIDSNGNVSNQIDIVLYDAQYSYLAFNQNDIQINGSAIECRINAEIPEKNFMPSPGVVQHMHLPAGNGVRVDTALYTGYKIPSEYDSMIAKVIVHAPDREAALQKMRSALDEMVVMGVETNLDFQYQIMKNQVFCDGKADTGFIENVLKIKG